MSHLWFLWSVGGMSPGCADGMDSLGEFSLCCVILGERGEALGLDALTNFGV